MAFAPVVAAQNVKWENFYQDGVAWSKAIGVGAPSLAASVQDAGRYFIVQMAVSNDTSSPLNVLPQDVRLSLIGRRPKFLRQIPPERIIAGNYTRVYWSEVLARFGALRSGSEEVQRQAGEQQRQMEKQAADFAQSISSGAIRANTLRPGQEMHGALYFEGERSCGKRSGCILSFRADFGGVTYPITITFGDTKADGFDRRFRPPKLGQEVSRSFPKLIKGDPLPEQGVPFLVQGELLKKLEVSEATYQNIDGITVAVAKGAYSPTRTNSKRPVIIAEGEHVFDAAAVMELYRLDVASNGHRWIRLFDSAGHHITEPIPLERTALSLLRYRFSPKEDLKRGQYCLTPKGSNELFLFSVH